MTEAAAIFPESLESPFMEILKTQLGITSSNLLPLLLVGAEDLESYLPVSTTL